MGASASAPTPEQAQQLRDSLAATCAEAARLIVQADVMLLCTGAGFSADSGLAVYADVARVAAYAQRGLEYHDICKTEWLHREPELFWGFWGQCHNDYRDTPPHEGYRIIDSWADRFFRHTSFGEAVRQRHSEFPEAGRADPYVVSDYPGGFFVFTSNVDAHHFDWFRACEIRECHGNTELYQCGRPSGPCSPAVWRAPLDYRFRVDLQAMLAPKGPPGDPTAAGRQEAPGMAASGQAEVAPAVGHVRGGGRSTTVRHMPAPPEGAAANAGFETNHPACRHCKAPARPAILMFGDLHWEDVAAQELRWDHWLTAVEQEAKKRLEAGERVRVVVLEIGAGSNVPTVRRTSEEHLLDFLKHGIDAKLVRVNPDLPLGDKQDLKPEGEGGKHILSVMGRGLESIQRINQAVEELSAQGAPRPAAAAASLAPRTSPGRGGRRGPSPRP